MSEEIKKNIITLNYSAINIHSNQINLNQRSYAVSDHVYHQYMTAKKTLFIAEDKQIDDLLDQMNADEASLFSDNGNIIADANGLITREIDYDEEGKGKKLRGRIYVDGKLLSYSFFDKANKQQEHYIISNVLKYHIASNVNYKQLSNIQAINFDLNTPAENYTDLKIVTIETRDRKSMNLGEIAILEAKFANLGNHNRASAFRQTADNALMILQASKQGAGTLEMPKP